MRLFPPLLYWSYGSEQCSNVSISVKQTEMKKGELMAESQCQRQSSLRESFGEVSGNDGSNVGQRLTWQDAKCGTNSVYWNSKWKIVLHLLGHHLLWVHQQRAHHEQITKPMYDRQATVSVFIVAQNHPMLDLRGLPWLLGCASCYLPFCSAAPKLLLSKVFWFFFKCTCTCLFKNFKKSTAMYNCKLCPFAFFPHKLQD